MLGRTADGPDDRHSPHRRSRTVIPKRRAITSAAVGMEPIDATGGDICAARVGRSASPAKPLAGMDTLGELRGAGGLMTRYLTFPNR
jgi:hypothetical protein